MADFERTVLEFYQLPSPYPSEWPAEKDAEDAATDGTDAWGNNKRTSRYQALESTVNERRNLMNTADGKGGMNSLVQRDEPDPLGSSDSVVRSLKNLGLPMQDDIRLRNRFLLSSTTFSPSLFLSQMHSDADTRSLLQGLDALSASIDQKSASLKVLVESNFERFVKAKATIDNVYKEMKYRGEEPQPKTHSRHASRSSFRNSDSKLAFNNQLAFPVSDNRKKNALTKESEYGVLGIKAPLLDVSAKAEEVWGPALGGREKEEHLKVVATHLSNFREYVDLSGIVADSIKRKDYESLVESYNRARTFADQARHLSKQLKGGTPDDTQLYQILLAARMWNDVSRQGDSFKTEVWKKLSSSSSHSKPNATAGRVQDQHIELISLLLELGVKESPIWVWLISRYDHLKSKIQVTGDRQKTEIEVLRRRLAASEKPTPNQAGVYLNGLGRQAIDRRPRVNDSAEVIELWEKMYTFLSNLISSQGIMGEIVEFWSLAQGFIDGRTQRTLPIGYNGESQVHHELSSERVNQLSQGAVELVEQIREHIYAFFAGLPPEDISILLSPLTPNPSSPASNNGVPGSLTPTALRDPRFNFDPSNPPPPSPSRGEPWEKLAFWPPWSNSLSGVHYLSRMLALVGSGASEMATIAPVAAAKGPNQEMDRLKLLIGASRERCVTALCAAWNRDAENIKHVEDWQRSSERGDVTRMPASFAAFEGTLLTGMQKILYISDATTEQGAPSIVLPPPAKLLQMVRSQYVTTLYKALSGMVENAERALKKTEEDDWSQAATVYTSTSSAGKSTLDAGDRNVRMLLTLSNLQALRSQVVPSLNSQFENAFSVKLTDESKTIKDVLGQIDARLFQSYTKHSIEKLRDIIQTGLASPNWVPKANQRPAAAKPYIYEALLTLVLVHSQVSTTAPSLTPQVLSFLLEQTSLQLLETFRTRPKYTLEALMQATLDVEFVAQTLSHYTTDRASELQSQIYQELDGRTDNDARARLQSELPEMRTVLKKLRENSKNEFACFKKPKRPPGSAAATPATANGGKQDGYTGAGSATAG
ncbi:exocyst complex component Sec5 [Cordyceps fumosorosea ARSEF 2679]|uniref:Exocyst complex component SEC5 n=1 Tax=Cordyceps fumosorosea (strain ARSEF 2679) TaxID=1081104 RepID=A0A167V8S0_CORFA|nr:exocyst complex component Sec5 [Cordyceps fumosorosea ARSEF 2679]OAA62350.1 exocyst complex component Sec5 [Cordyceps fumosorosea ARSEF 2679]